MNRNFETKKKIKIYFLFFTNNSDGVVEIKLFMLKGYVTVLQWLQFQIQRMMRAGSTKQR